MGGFPNQNLIVGWVLRTVAIPNINPHQVMKTTQALVKQAMQNKDKQKFITPLSETKDVELEKVPENELKRPKASGWIENEAPNVVTEESKRKAFQERFSSLQGGETATQTHSRRNLPTIPSTNSNTSNLQTNSESSGGSRGIIETQYCPHCGKDLNWKFCPHCGKQIPHS